MFTYIRSKDYMPLLKQLVCTFKKSNPGVELGVMLVPGELGTEAVQWMQRKNLTLVEVPPLNYPNHFNPRLVRGGLACCSRRVCWSPAGAVVSELVCMQQLAVCICSCVHTPCCRHNGVKRSPPACLARTQTFLSARTTYASCMCARLCVGMGATG